MHENERHNARDQRVYQDFFGQMVKAITLEGHDLVRRVDKQVEVLIWCRKCSDYDYARQRMGPKLMNCCKP